MTDIYLASASAADDAAFSALHDLSQVLGDEDETAIIGGHMVSLLNTAFPSAGQVLRRTNDADGGIPTALARSGDVHEKLIARGYRAVGGNRYVRDNADAPESVMDILVPNFTSRLRAETLGGRRFDSLPGLALELSERLCFDVVARLSSGTELKFTVNVPTVEGAVILKSYAWSGRRAPKDAIDLHSLFRIVEKHDASVIGGWQLKEARLIGARLDASRHLHELARNWEAHPPRIPFDHKQLVSSIRTFVTSQVDG